MLTGVLAPSAVAAQPAPPAEAEATAAEVEPVAAIGETSARADEESGEAGANAVRLGDEPPSEEFGGTQSGEGTSEGAMIDTGDQPPGRAQVAPWQASVEDGQDERSAESDAALARLTVVDRDTAHVEVLASRSSARHTDARSTGESESTGASVMLGGEDGLRLVLLRAFASSEGEGHSYIVGINDTELFTSDQAEGQCQVEVPELLRLICLTAEGGEADGVEEFVALIVGIQTRDELPDVAISAAAARGGPEGEPVAAAAAAAPEEDAAVAPGGPAAVGPTPAAGALAVTGSDLWLVLAVGAALILLGGLSLAARWKIALTR